MVEREPAFRRLNGGGMSNGRETGLTSAFDELLARNRQQFDGLFGGAGSQPRRAKSITRPAATDPTFIVLDALTSPTARALDTRFEDGWHYEILEQRDAGDEVVVTCRLAVPELGTTVIGHGRASRGAGDRVEGRLGDIPFSAGAATDNTTPRSALQAAAEMALADCRAQIDA